MKKIVQVREFFGVEEGHVEYILYHACNIDIGQTRKLFSPQYLEDQGILIGNASAGRGNAYFFIADGCEFVLRHYCRGGWVARFNKDQYRWQGLEATRAYCEFELLVKMIEMGLPVPIPYAARVCRSGSRYSADLITERILNAQSLAELCAKEEEQKLWAAVGETVRRFHDQQIYHADLNAHNILVTKNGAIYLIDFDKCKIRPSSNRWKKNNIDRLKRSLDKLKKKGAINFKEEYWSIFLAAYHT